MTKLFVVPFFWCCFVVGAFAQINIDTTKFEQLLTTAIPKSSFIMIGEAHQIAGTHELQTYIIEQFVKQGYTTLVMECGVGEAKVYQEYLKTGNTKLLQLTRASVPYYRTFIDQLRAINPNLELIGVDFERDISLNYWFQQWKPQLQHPDLVPFNRLLDKIERNTPAPKVKRTLQALLKEYQVHKNLIHKLLPDHAPTLAQILHNPVYLADFSFTSKKRDACILKNLLALPNSTLENALLVFGSNHFTHDLHFWKGFREAKANDLQSFLILPAYHNCSNYNKDQKYSSATPLADYLGTSTSTSPVVEFELHQSSNYGALNEQQQFVVAILRNQ